MEDINEKEVSTEDIKECVRQALCRMLQDALELNDIRREVGQDENFVRANEEDLLEDFQLMLDWFRLIEYNKKHG